MSFTDQKPFKVTAEDIKKPWSGGINGEYFRCGLCGHRFQVGDTARWQYTNNIPGAGGNPMVCERCDGTKDQVAEKWMQMHAEAKGRMWWFCRQR